ncbi:MAG: acetyl-CoA carboxylase biotin carboxyl carrier protein subunit [Clostridia bacterium]|nr:acetyl-CoA carboxylase biotin carboxyl carrier protein subunit [Clostridia bacterium]
MKKFNVTINGKTYEVEVEEVGSVQNTVSVAAPVTAAPVSAPVVEVKKTEPASKPVSTASVPAGANVVKSPMPGTILKVNVEKGASVKKGDTLVILEAMKMENEIKAASDGTIVAVHTVKGASVNTNDPLVSLS